MKHLAVAIVLVLCAACNSKHKKKETGQLTNEVHQHAQEAAQEQGSANAYMRQSSVEHLIRRFESPERDAYQQPQKVLDYLGDLEGKTIMDIGAGSGYFSVKLAEKGAKVIAADVDDDFQAFLQRRIAENNLENIETRKIPYDSPALKTEEVDMVLMVNAYHHIENRPDYFAKVKKGTKADGALVIIDYFKYEIPVGPPVNHKVSMDVVINELKKAGYTIFDVNAGLLEYQYVIRAE
ncbi:class I SAM-dependent methyltransferase [Robiginitalea aurantiaca]|uniref:Class I SAM-dependent methyltransferase n=1 Tax=Robiginitalea aurantiaca TaxID=3056915 RepID=A0ABT7WIT7_9FLAO|nr:class I SAM-dependent methyltransferase [Robiginitalea aurantiaca]MDM9632783.1 class I SAM-dependent methyltransferase [Robiginitalea aurantiaca]